MFDRNVFPRRLLSALLCPVLLAGCAVGPDYRRASEPPVTLSQAVSPALYASDRLQQDWWRQFQDPQLDALIERALAANHDIRLAQARLLEARAVLDERQLDRLPTVTAGAAYSRSLAQDNPGPAGERNLAQSYRGGLDVQWELDLFGRLQRLSEAAAARGEAAADDLAQARILVTAEVASQYFQWYGAQRQLAVARASLENQDASVAVVQSLVGNGRGSPDELASALALRARTQATLPPLETRRDLARYRLAVLVGVRPDQLQALDQAPALAPLVARLPLGDIGDLLRRRPDVASAERALAAANADVGAITAELYPRIDLGGFLGFVALRGGDWGDGASRAFSVLPSASWPALHLASVKARQRAAEARHLGAQARYEQVALRAIEETEAALTTYSQSQQRLRALADAAGQSARASALAGIRYQAGRAPYLVQLDAQRTLLDAQDALAQADTASYLDVVALYKALGGGWQSVPALTAN
ncbi:efflux transporter outer membrane subunit [Pseudomonas chlororaphis]|uniref:RND transporter n=1 Tax=Pseudomonas chlororaphis TaxID=587753 RepID=A0A1Q8EPP3_9PSED|nr:TolC family protein [Pseudomonas chlororaphis]OLF53758.1 RND transporter [Pseudomonas chlororaphis]